MSRPTTIVEHLCERAESGPALTARELAEAAWLLITRTVAEPSPSAREVMDWHDTDEDEEDDQEPQESGAGPWARGRLGEGMEPEHPERVEEATPEAREDAATEERNAVGLPMEGPGAGWAPRGFEPSPPPPLNDALGQAAGLAGLALQREERDRQCIDLQRTIAWSARAGEPMLATRPGRRKSAHVILMVDRSSSLVPWEAAVAELCRLLRHAPGLAAATFLDLDLGLGKEPTFRLDGKQVRIGEVGRPGFDTIALLWSDGVAPGFRHLGGLLARLPSGTRCVWLHPWPRHAWRRTALLTLRPARALPVDAGASAVPLTVVNIVNDETRGAAGARTREAWAAVGALVRGQRPIGYPTVGLPVRSPGRQAAPLPAADDDERWLAYSDRVLSTVSPSSGRLLGLAAALPVEHFHIDTLRALADTLGLKDTRFLLAEALTSGLLRVSATGTLSFRSLAAQVRAQDLLDLADLRAVTTFAEEQGLGPTGQASLLTRKESGRRGGKTTEVTTRAGSLDNTEGLDPSDGSWTEMLLASLGDLPATTTEQDGVHYVTVHGRRVAAIRAGEDSLEARVRSRVVLGQPSPAELIQGRSTMAEGWLDLSITCSSMEDVADLGQTIQREWADALPVLLDVWSARATDDVEAAWRLARALVHASGLSLDHDGDELTQFRVRPSPVSSDVPDKDLVPVFREGARWLERAAKSGSAAAAEAWAWLGLVGRAAHSWDRPVRWQQRVTAVLGDAATEEEVEERLEQANPARSPRLAGAVANGRHTGWLRGTDTDRQEALLTAARAGVGSARWYAGNMLLDEPNTPPSLREESQRWLESLAGEEPAAATTWAVRLCDGVGVQRDEARGMALLREASDRGCLHATGAYVLRLLLRRPTPEEPTEATQHVLDALNRALDRPYSGAPWDGGTPSELAAALAMHRLPSLRVPVLMALGAQPLVRGQPSAPLWHRLWTKDIPFGHLPPPIEPTGPAQALRAAQNLAGMLERRLRHAGIAVPSQATLGKLVQAATSAWEEIGLAPDGTLLQLVKQASHIRNELAHTRATVDTDLAPLLEAHDRLALVPLDLRDAVGEWVAANAASHPQLLPLLVRMLDRARDAAASDHLDAAASSDLPEVRREAASLLLEPGGVREPDPQRARTILRDLSNQGDETAREMLARLDVSPGRRPKPPPTRVRGKRTRTGALMSLPKLLQPALKVLEKDLLARTRLPGVEAGLKAAHAAERKAEKSGLGFDPWRRERVTQIAVAWVLSVVFVRHLEDRGFIDPRIGGATPEALRTAEDREGAFTQLAPFLGPREYLLTVFRELAKLPGARHVFDRRHNPVWVLAPSSKGAQALLEFFRRRDEAGEPALRFAVDDTRFLGDLYQDLSEAVRKRYALLQTPDFVEEFILEQTLDPAIEAFGLDEVRLIDPTCGSGHFVLGAFRRLLSRWQAAHPTRPVEELAHKALDQVFGVDINPYAVAIARFRLVMEALDAVGIRRLDAAPDLKPNLVVADSLLHRFDERTQLRLSQQLTMEDAARWGDALFSLQDPVESERILSQRYHAVVGNPPYITEKDAKKRKTYREMYESASGKYALAAPFTERFFELGVAGGFVGLINSNAWTKRDYGKALIEKVLPNLDLQRMIDTAGCYIPGHGTPTLLLFGRNRPPGDAPITAVLGKRGEQEVPADPSAAPVWMEIVEHGTEIGFEGAHISVELLPRKAAAHHPWVLQGGGARPFLASVLEPVGPALGDFAESVGVVAVTGEDSVFPQSAGVMARQRVQPTIGLLEGDVIGDWQLAGDTVVPWMYDDGFTVREPETIPAIIRFLWPSKAVISRRKRFGVPMLAKGYRWFELQELYSSKLHSPFAITFSLVTTHFRCVLTKHRTLFKNSAPVVKLGPAHGETDYQALLGYLNSSTTAFWCRLVMFPKGGDQMGAGGRLSRTPWQDRLEYAGNLLQQLPVPDMEQLKESLLDLVQAAEDTVADMQAHSPENVLGEALAETPSLSGLRAAREQMVSTRTRLRHTLVSLQEEMDWRVYGLFGLPTVTADSVDAVRVLVAPEHRPIEVRLARDVDTDISASEWFRLHQRTPPSEVGGPLADLYRQRLRLLDDEERGRQLRLLETPETKRRWQPVDDHAAFDAAAKSWLLDQVEAQLRDMPQPELRTALQIALELSRDPRVAAVHELLTDTDLTRWLSKKLDESGVPFLAAYRYTETGMEKRAQWEQTWELQRAEDSGDLEDALLELALPEIPVPDKYKNGDFQRHYWSLRKALDVPTERFVTIPGGTTDDDPTTLVGWAGWNHLQQAQALGALYQRRKDQDGWSKEQLVPLLAGLQEQVPWVRQWHNEPSAQFAGMRMGDFFRDFVNAQAHEIGVARSYLREWRPAAPVRGRGRPRRARAPSITPDQVLAALDGWAGDEDARPDDLVEAVGATKATVSKVLKQLVEEGRAERTSGRPARYRAVTTS